MHFGINGYPLIFHYFRAKEFVHMESGLDTCMNVCTHSRMCLCVYVSSMFQSILCTDKNLKHSLVMINTNLFMWHFKEIYIYIHTVNIFPSSFTITRCTSGYTILNYLPEQLAKCLNFFFCADNPAILFQAKFPLKWTV